VSIVDIPGLHEAIAFCLIEEKPHLTGPEFRFLRKALDMSQKRLSNLMGKTDQSIARWEKLGRVPKDADHWIRALYFSKHGDPNIEALIDRITSIDRDYLEKKWEFEETKDGWRTRAA